jgi:hypothetical protein
VTIFEFGTGSLLNEITEILKLDGEVDIADDNVFRDVQDDGREIKNSGDAASDQLIGNFLSRGGGDRQNCHLDTARGHDFGHFINGVKRLADILVAFTKIDVEPGDNLEAFLLEALVRKQGQAHVTDSDQDDWLKAICPEEISNHLAELLDIITETARSELTEISEVFPQLRGFDARRSSEGIARDRANPVLLQPLKAAQIDRQTIDRFSRNLWSKDFFQSAWTLGQWNREHKRELFQTQRKFKPSIYEHELVGHEQNLSILLPRVEGASGLLRTAELLLGIPFFGLRRGGARHTLR